MAGSVSAVMISVPSASQYGQTLIGNTNGTYTPTATSSLGLPTFSSLNNYLSLSSWYATTTDGLDEGLTNLYYTNPRVQTYLDTLSKGYFYSTTSADYWDTTKTRWSTTSNTYWLTQQTTDGLAQGSTNKYFANSLVDTWLGTKNLGVFWSTTSADHWYTLQNKASTTLLGDANIWSTLQDFSAGITTSDVNTNSFTSHDFANTFFEFTNAGASLNLPSTSNYLTLKNSTDSGSVNLRMENLTGAHDIYFPDQGGTFAMLSDITNASSTLYADNGTFSGLNTFADISFTNATGSNVTSSVFCLIGDTCISAWPTGGSGSGVGTVGTSTSEFSGAIPFFSTNGGYPALLSSDSNFQWDGTNRMLTIGSGGGNFTFQNNAGGSLMVQGSGIFENQTTGGFLTQEPLSVVDNLGSGYIGSIHTDLMSGHHSYYLPDNDGTLALLSDISGATASSTLHADFNTFSGVNIFNNKIGIGTSSPFAKLSIVGNTSEPQFVIATSTLATPIFAVNSTTSSRDVQKGGRVSVNTSSYYANSELLDSMVINGAVNTMDWKIIDCAPSWSMLTADLNIACADSNFWIFYEDGTAQQTPFTGPVGNPGAKIESTAGTANDGGGVFGGAGVAWLTFTKNTPILEAQMAINGQATGTLFYLGFTNLNNAASSFEVAPTQGCYFTASTSKANWQAICSTSASAMTIVDTGVASSTVVNGRGTPMRFRLQSNGSVTSFYIGTTTSNFVNVANISSNIPASTTRLMPSMYMSWIAAAAASNTRDMEWSRLKLMYQNNPNLEIFIP